MEDNLLLEAASSDGERAEAYIIKLLVGNGPDSLLTNGHAVGSYSNSINKAVTSGDWATSCKRTAKVIADNVGDYPWHVHWQNSPELKKFKTFMREKFIGTPFEGAYDKWNPSDLYFTATKDFFSRFIDKYRDSGLALITKAYNNSVLQVGISLKKIEPDDSPEILYIRPRKFNVRYDPTEIDVESFLKTGKQTGIVNIEYDGIGGELRTGQLKFTITSVKNNIPKLKVWYQDSRKKAAMGGSTRKVIELTEKEADSLVSPLTLGYLWEEAQKRSNEDAVRKSYVVSNIINRILPSNEAVSRLTSYVRSQYKGENGIESAEYMLIW